jgi:hypothetical protein
MIRRAEMRRQLRIAQQLKVATLVIVALLLLAAYPAYVFARAATQDPIIGELDGLDLPGWAALYHQDAISGSRWCIEQCKFRERSWLSDHSPEETNAAYVHALGADGWRVRAGGFCPPVTEGIATCWQHDEYYMDMWVHSRVCNLPPPRPSIKPGATASASPTPTPTPTSTSFEDLCPATLVTVKVYNAIDYHPVD